MGVTPTLILVDVDPGMPGDALLAALGERVRQRTARTPGDAVDVVASLDPAVLVVAPTHRADGPPTGAANEASPDADGHARSDQVAAHRAVVERTRWWVEAAAVTGAFVVLASTTAAVEHRPAAGATGQSPPPDEFTVALPSSPMGRAWRAAEALTLAAGGAVVRSDGDDPGAHADLVAWVVAGRRRGTWHVGGPLLDDLHTRVVRGIGGDTGSAVSA